MDIEMLTQQVTGLQAKLTELRTGENLFHKAKGLDEEIEKARKDVTKIELDNQTVKEELAELRGQKAAALASTAEALSEKMSLVLPEGKALLEIGEDGSVWIGWELNGVRRPHKGLSGGQRVLFNQALSFAMLGEGEKILIVEAAELDDARLLVALEHLSRLPEDVQVVLSTCHVPPLTPTEWSVVEVK